MKIFNPFALPLIKSSLPVKKQPDLFRIPTINMKNVVSKSNGFTLDLQLFGVDYSTYSDKGLKSSLKNHQKALEEHLAKRSNIEANVTDWNNRDPRYKDGIARYWDKEINNIRNQIKAIEEEHRRRGLK